MDELRRIVIPKEKTKAFLKFIKELEIRKEVIRKRIEIRTRPMIEKLVIENLGQ